ncbi:MAG: aldehyde dehydrogenase family protein [Candidatus Eisenbacteria bacterium]
MCWLSSARRASGRCSRRSHPRPNRLRCVLGLGAKNAAIVPTTRISISRGVGVRARAFSYNGQRCTAIKIVFVQRARAEAFVAKIAEQVETLRVGMPWEDGVRITPLPEEGKPAWLASLVAEPVAGGARVVNRGGGTIDETLFYPAIVYPATAAMEISKVEQFGPVLPIVPFDHPSEVLDWMTASSVGQQCALFGTNPRDIAPLVDQLVNQVCRVNLNSQCQRGPDTFPFGGRKDSAEGTLSVSDALRVFSIRSLVAAKMTAGNQAVLKDVVTGRMSGFLSTDFIF